jgi:hypothetical protein
MQDYYHRDSYGGYAGQYENVKVAYADLGKWMQALSALAKQLFDEPYWPGGPPSSMMVWNEAHTSWTWKDQPALQPDEQSEHDWLGIEWRGEESS